MSGYVIGRATVDRVEVLLEQNSDLSIGDFVVLEEGPLRILGVVDNMLAGHNVASRDIMSIEAVKELSKDKDIGAFRLATIRLVGTIEDGRIEGLPRRPPSVLSRVRKASNEEVEMAIGEGREGRLELGHVLSNPEIPAKVNLNRMVARHLAILSMTGGGKSNTVAVIAEEIGKIGGTVIILDFHDEYVVIGENFGKAKGHVIEPKINPFLIEPEILMDFIGIHSNATVQRSIFSALWRDLTEKWREREEVKLLESMIKKLEEAIEYFSIPKSQRNNVEKPPGNPLVERKDVKVEQLDSVKAKIKDFIDIYGDIINYNTSSPVELIVEGRVNIVKVGMLPDNILDFYVKILLMDILLARKNKKLKTGRKPVLEKPIFVIIEEAHILVSKNRQTKTKHIVAKIAREGRKFGVGLALVSQRPSKLDQDVLSQMNSIIALRMISNKDKEAVAGASDQLSEDMVESLSSLNPGEALLVGAFVPFPYFAKIKKAEEGLLTSSDPKIFDEWGFSEKEVMRDADLM